MTAVYRWLRWAACWLALILLVLVTLAVVASAHQPYTDWIGPNGSRCCSDLNRECRAVRSYWDDEIGQFRILHKGEWVPVPPTSVLKISSPDGSSHACIGITDYIFCFVNGVPRS